MSMTAITTRKTLGTTPELVAGLAVIILMILGLAGVASNFLIASRQLFSARASSFTALLPLGSSWDWCRSVRLARQS